MNEVSKETMIKGFKEMWNGTDKKEAKWACEIFIREKDIQKFCEEACPFTGPSNCLRCSVKTLEEHDKELRNEIFKDIKNGLLNKNKEI